MNLTISQKQLLSALQLAKDVIKEKTTTSILSNVLLETKDKGLTILSTDLESSIKILIPANISEHGAITLHANKLTEIVKSLPVNNDVNIIANDSGRTIIKSEDIKIKANFKINGMLTKDFPIVPEIENKIHFKISQKDFKQMIRKTIFATSSDYINSSINGVKFEMDNKFKLIATDGRILAFIQEDLKDEFSINNVIVPHQILNILLKILSDEGIIEIFFAESQICFKLNNMELISRLIDGVFPDYEQVIPKEYSKNVLVSTNMLLTALQRVSLLSDNMIILNFKKNILEITSNSEIGEAKENIEIEYNGNDFEIAFNKQYLLNAILSIDTDKIIIKMNESQDPVEIRDDNSDNFLCLVMPIKL